MKCTVRDVVEAHAQLTRLGGLSLAPALSMRFGRLTRAIRDEAEIAEEARRKILEDHTPKDAAGVPKPILTLNDLTNPKAFDLAVKELHKDPVEIPGEPFKLSELGDKPLNSDLLASLHFAIVDG